MNGKFERPVQTVKAVSVATGISRSTLLQAAQRSDFGEDAYKSEGTWLIDTTGKQFLAWLERHWKQSRVKGEANKVVRTTIEEFSTVIVNDTKEQK